MNTSANYLGLQLNSPIVIGACSLTQNPEMVRQLSIAGAGAIVLPSLFEEQIVHHMFEDGERAQPVESHFEAIDYDEANDRYNGGPIEYLASIKRLKRVTGIPVIANLNGCSTGDWLNFAREIELSGADAIEVTLDCELANAPRSANDVDQDLVGRVAQVCDIVDIPVSVKLSPFHSNLPHLAWQLVDAGVAGLVCFAHEPAWHIAIEQVGSTFNWGLTPASNINGTIAGLVRVRAGGPEISVAASGGVCVPQDLIKTILAGADVAMVTSEVYRSGPDAVAHILDGVSSYLNRHGFMSFAELIASRPSPLMSMRSMQIGCFTRGREFVEPTAGIQFHSGDRWGHLQ